MGLVILAVVLFVVIGIVGYLVGIYNGLILVRNNIDKAWANIDVLLKQRHDELPKLVETCKGYMKYEQGLLEKITQARTAFMSASSIEDKTKAENQLTAGLKTLFAVSENYPDLKANQNFLQLQNRISGLENEIADRREFFNESVNVYNIRIQQLPDVFFAGPLGYSKRSLLEIPKEETQDVKIQF
ncbi:MAG TPA: LemA family protein [Candidatus Omnitrophota bacterium]|mgnify:CR=1 FL=1|nr:LemA family protein [Candidatus Omnitrophota bacterium]HPS36919.1 LemA family protein [Candidatus Omnitrophota bacterium]